MATRVIRCSLVALKTIDRYLVREIVPPALLALIGLTFVLMMPPILQNAAKLIEKGVAWSVVLGAPVHAVAVWSTVYRA